MSMVYKFRGLAQFYSNLFSGLWIAEMRLRGVHFAGRPLITGRPIVGVAPDSSFQVGDRVRIQSSLRSNPIACFQPCVLRTMNPGARLILKNEVGLSGAVVCAGHSIEIGERTIAGSGAMIIDNDFHRWDDDLGWSGDSASSARPIVIGKGVFIGARAVILKGVSIGDGAIIGAGAIVTRDVPPRATAVAQPTRIVGAKSDGSF